MRAPPLVTLLSTLVAVAVLAAAAPPQKPRPTRQPRLPAPQHPPTLVPSTPATARSPFDLGEITEADTNRPKLIVLLHGATPSPNASATPGIPEPDSGTLDYTRYYFGYDFVRRLLGVSRSVGLKTLSGVVLDERAWSRHDTPDAHNKVHYTEGARENVLDDRFLVPGNFTGAAPPPLAVLLTFRDGSRSLMDQAETAIDQIFDAYSQKFGTVAHPVTTLPDLILVGHSMGNLVSRVILSAPADPIQAERLSDDQRQKAAALRDRTLYFVSLAGPHEGSPLADRAIALTDAVNGIPQPLLDLLNTVTNGAASDVKTFVHQELGKTSNHDLQTTVWSQLNAGVLAPQTARRTDGTLVPVYTLIGHSPGGDYFTDPLAADQYPGGGIDAGDLLDPERRRDALTALGLMFVDYLLHNVPGDGPHGWGSTNDVAFDKVARYHRKTLGLTLSDPGEEDGLPLGFPKFYSRVRITREEHPLIGDPHTVVVRTNHDGEIDSDGLVGVASGHGLHLGTRTANFFDHTVEWRIDGDQMFGSWYRLSSEGAPWEFANHERIHRLGGTGNWLHANLIAQAGPFVSMDPADEISVWSRPLTRNEALDQAKAKAIAKAKRKAAIARAKAKIKQRLADSEDQDQDKDKDQDK